MHIDEETSTTDGTKLCKSCGMCCTGHLFAWVKLKPSELDQAEALGMEVNRSEPSERGFNQPCPLWKGECTIYHSPHYPRACRSYRCRLLKEVTAGSRALAQAHKEVERTRGMIREIEALLPPSSDKNFRERLVAYIEHPPEGEERKPSYQKFREEANRLLGYFEQYFGVNDFLV